MAELVLQKKILSSSVAGSRFFQEPYNWRWILEEVKYILAITKVEY